MNLSDKKQFEELLMHALDKNQSTETLSAAGVAFLATLAARICRGSTRELNSIVDFFSSQIKYAALEIINCNPEIH